MIIQQNCMFSFEEQLSFQEKTELHRVLERLNFTTINMALAKSYGQRGPKGYHPEHMISALIAMHLEKISTVKKLVQHLRENPALRYSCGFNVLTTLPSESTFSRFNTKLSTCPELYDMFLELVCQAKECGVVTGDNISVDSTKLGSYEAAKPSSKIDDNGLVPNWGIKKSTQGNNEWWFGWKLHMICDSESELPLDILITPANVHDSNALVPLLDSFRHNYEDVLKPKYVTLDSGYDTGDIYEHVFYEFHASPIIALNERGSFAPPEGMNENYEPICSAGYPLSYYGKDGDYLKLRCPHATGDCECYYGSNWCSSSAYGYTRKLNWKKDLRYLGYPHRGSPKWKGIYNTRTSVERAFSRHKVNLNLDNIRSCGINKARIHAILSSITLIAATLVKTY